MKNRMLILSAALCIFTLNTYSEEIFKLDTVVVTGTKTEHTLENTPVKTEVITSDDLFLKGITNLEQAFAHIGSVEAVRQSGSWGNKGQLMIQGLPAKHTLVLIDGVKYIGGHNGVDFSSIPVSSIERIEIVKGSVSALYGSEGISGVINIITKKSVNQSSLSVSTSKYNTESINFSYGEGDSNMNYILNYSYFNTDGIRPEYISSGRMESDKYRQNSYNAKINFSNSNNFYTLNTFSSEQVMKSGLTATTWQDRTQKRQNNSFIWDNNISEREYLNFKYSTFKYEHYTENKTTEYEDNASDIELNYIMEEKNGNSLVIGIQKSDEERVDVGKGIDHDRKVNSYFIQKEFSTDNLTTVLALRNDDYDEHGSQTNPKVSFKYDLNSDNSLRLSYGESFSAPTLVNMYGGWTMGPFLVIPNPNLKPEEGKSMNLNYTHYLSDKSSYELSFFQNKVENMIASTTAGGPPPRPMNWINIDKAKTQGFDLKYNFQTSDFTKNSISFSKLDAEDENTGLTLPGRADNTIVFTHEKFIPENKLTLSLNVRYTGKRYDDAANTIELSGFTTADLSIAKFINDNTTMNIRIENLTGKKDISDKYSIDGSVFSLTFGMNF